MPFDDLTGTIVRKICMACSREFTGVSAHCPHDGNLLVSLPQDQWEGKRLADRYRIDKRLGTGGMGVVYLAWHEMMDRWVAIKMLKQSFCEDELSLKRFQQEAKAASRLKHPNVITLYDFGLTNTGQPYMVMDYLASTHSDKSLYARSLADEIKELGQLPVERCIHIIAQACEALDHAHRQGVIHRDVKPANIMIVPTEDDPDFVKVVDFGVAKLMPINSTREDTQGITQVGEVCGSPVYMSPEQCMGQSLDPRADIYSMGVVLYEAITGRLPLVGKNMVDTMSKHLNETAPTFKQVRPDLYVPEKLEQVVRSALAKEPHKRPQTMAQLAQDLQFSIPRAGHTPNLKTHEIIALPEEEKEGKGWVTFAAIAGGVAVAAVAGGVFFFMNAKQASPPATSVQPPAVQTAPTASAHPAKTPLQKLGVESPGAVQAATTTGAQPPAATPAAAGTATASSQAPQPVAPQAAAPPHPVVAAVHKSRPAPVRNKKMEDQRFAELMQLKGKL